MATSREESVRKLHEEIELCQTAIVHELSNKARTHRERIFQDHRVCMLLDRISQRSKQLEEFYQTRVVEEEGKGLKGGTERVEDERMTEEQPPSSGHNDHEGNEDGNGDGDVDGDIVPVKEDPSVEQSDPYEEFRSATQRIIRFYDRKRAHIVDDPFTGGIRSSQLVPEPKIAFSGPEKNGRFLDLDPFYQEFVDLFRPSEDFEYEDFLSSLREGSVGSIVDGSDQPRKRHKYIVFLRKLIGYLEGFHFRIRPLERRTVRMILDATKVEFDRRRSDVGSSKTKDGDLQMEMEDGGREGREEGKGKDMDEEMEESVDRNLLSWDGVNTINDLMSRYSMDEMKQMLQHRGMKCGGTHAQRAERLFALKDLSMDDPIPERLLARDSKKTKKITASTSTLGVKGSTVLETALAGPAGLGSYVAPLEVLESVATETSSDLLELYVERLVDLLDDIVTATKNHVERKRMVVSLDGAMIDEEEEEDLEELDEALEEEEDKDEVIYNPKGVPLGPDGKPIPYWLYKLHGLNIKFTCEICGNHTYWGPRAYERHFQEWRHSRAMRLLGIPNTKHFHHVTKIADARNLYEKLSVENEEHTFHPDMEEFEDSSGNVLKKRTYMDLKKQGYI